MSESPAESPAPVRVAARRSPTVDLIRSFAALPTMILGSYLDLIGNAALAAGKAVDRFADRIEGS